MSVDALRNQFIKIVIEIYEDLTEFIFSKDIQTDKELDFILKEPKYIPKGFKEVEKENTLQGIFIRYENKNSSEIRYRSNQIDSNTVILDTEDAKVTDVMVNDYKAKYIIKDNSITIFWNDEENVYTIYFDYDNKNDLNKYEDDLIDIAKNIK
ncbi:DUF4367 domain-containing protein [Clostridioides sp. ES-S-0145-01]|nr:DUF4367 domain-containing protein [Clostridioides sp. ES-S-0145-01]